MNRHTTAILVTTALAVLFTTLPVLAQEGPPEGPPPGEGELRERLQEAFQNRLRAALGLTDEQMEAIVPRLMELEEVRRDVHRERRRTAHALHQGLAEGMGDAELQELLDRLEALQKKELEAVDGAFAEVDRDLTVRQRVQLRFFIDEFRKRVQGKMREFHGRRGPRGPGRQEWRQR
jgi:hypothetical protein